MSAESLLHDLIYDKGGISILWEAMDLFNKWYWDNWLAIW